MTNENFQQNVTEEIKQEVEVTEQVGQSFIVTKMNEQEAVSDTHSMVTAHKIKAIQRRSKKLSVVDRRAAMRLRELWENYKEQNGVNQETFAKEKLGWTQGNFSQYLTGGVPIGQKSLLRLCEALGCKPGDIREELQDKSMVTRNEMLAKILGKSLNMVKDLAGTEMNEKTRKFIEDAKKAMAN